MHKISVEVATEITAKESKKIEERHGKFAEEMQDKIKEQQNKMYKIQAKQEVFRPIQNLALGSDDLLDSLTKHVLAEGFNKKLRELRAEFMSKHDFQTKIQLYLTDKDLDTLRRELMGQISSQKNKLYDLSQSE